MKEVLEIFAIMLAIIFCTPFGWIGLCIFFYGLYTCINAKTKRNCKECIKNEK